MGLREANQEDLNLQDTTIVVKMEEHIAVDWEAKSQNMEN